MEQFEKGKAKADFLSTRGTGISEFSDDIMKLGAGVILFGLGVWLLMATPAPSQAYIKEVVAGGALTIHSIVSLRST